MKISLVLCTYNGEKYIIEQLDSLREQTYPLDEVIIRDDCSLDKTADIIREYIENYQLKETWNFEVNKKNKGYADNFHNALMAATGDIIFFCDQDDIWHTNKIEGMVNIMRKYSDIKLLGSEFIPFYSTKDAPAFSKHIRDDKSLEKVVLNQKTIFIENGCEGCTECIRREFRDQINKYWFSGFAHDEFVWKMGLCFEGCYIWHSILMKRRFHSNNTSKQKIHDINKRIIFVKKLLKSHEEMKKCAEEYGMLDEKKKLIDRNIQLVKLRIDVLENKNISAWIISILRYLFCYQTPRSAFVDLYVAVSQRKESD